MGLDVLNLEWSSSGRDREVATLICYALRKRGYSTIEASIFNYKYYLLRHRPRLLYAADPKGASNNYQAVQFAHRLGIPVVTFTAEGNYTPEKIEKMFWGHVTGKRLLERINLQWSDRARRLALQVDPSLASQLKVSGAVGFDRYKIYQFYTKHDWARKYGKAFPYMIGYAGWGFDEFHRFSESELLKLYSRDQIEWFRQERIKVNTILRQLIERNPTMLFLLKEHPGVVSLEHSELAELQHYPNALYIHREEAIADCINPCDIWMAFESTTCLEAWLLSKPTLLINPSGSSFARSDIYKGCLIASTLEQTQNALDHYYETGVLPGWAEKQARRNQVIRDTIQWADGKNHMRAAYLIEQVLKTMPPGPIRPTVSDHLGASLQNQLFERAGLLSFLPRFRYRAMARARFQQSELDELIQRYTSYLESFHQQHPLTEQDIEELESLNS
jgi:hypothetical protein